MLSRKDRLAATIHVGFAQIGSEQLHIYLTVPKRIRYAQVVGRGSVVDGETHTKLSGVSQSKEILGDKSKFDFAVPVLASNISKYVIRIWYAGQDGCAAGGIVVKVEYNHSRKEGSHSIIAEHDYWKEARESESK